MREKGEQSGIEGRETRKNEKNRKTVKTKGRKYKTSSQNVKSPWLTFYDFIPSAQAKSSLRQQIDLSSQLPLSVSVVRCRPGPKRTKIPF
jgi:hypothetical protein